MANYRIYFKDQHEVVIGRDDYAAADDEHALAIARTLRNACADMCARIELWDGVRRVDTVRPNPSPLSLSEILARTESTVLERELALHESKWIVAESARLLRETQHLLDHVRRRAP